LSSLGPMRKGLIIGQCFLKVFLYQSYAHFLSVIQLAATSGLCSSPILRMSES